MRLWALSVALVIVLLGWVAAGAVLCQATGVIHQAVGIGMFLLPLLALLTGIMRIIIEVGRAAGR